MQSLYAWDFTHAPAEALSEFFWLDEKDSPGPDDTACAFAALLIAGTIENIEVVDVTIRGRLEHWDFSRLSRVDLSILRMSVFCLLFMKDIPASVVIDEAVDISKEFGTDDSFRFINGVLDGIRKNIDKDI